MSDVRSSKPIYGTSPPPAKPVDEEEEHSRKDKLKAHHDDLDTMIELEKKYSDFTGAQTDAEEVPLRLAV